MNSCKPAAGIYLSSAINHFGRRYIQRDISKHRASRVRMRIRKRYAVKYFTAVVSFGETGRIKPLCNDAIKHRIENFRSVNKNGREREGKKIQRRLTKNKFANSTNPLVTGRDKRQTTIAVKG